MNKELGDRMKRYEASTRVLLPRRTYTLIRVDGKAFHTYTRGMDQPFDDGLIHSMNQTARELCKQVQGAVMAYVQSDEISLLVEDFGPQADAWFDGSLQKMCSVSSSIATEVFNRAQLTRMIEDTRGDIDGSSLVALPWGQFDSRVFTIPEPVEVANYFVWRQMDAIRNSVSSVARSMFSHNELNGKNTGAMKGMISYKGQAWENYPDGCLRGRVVLKSMRMVPTTFKRKDTGEESTVDALRTFWDISAPPVFTEDQAFLGNIIANIKSANKS